MECFVYLSCYSSHSYRRLPFLERTSIQSTITITKTILDRLDEPIRAHLTLLHVLSTLHLSRFPSVRQYRTNDRHMASGSRSVIHRRRVGHFTISAGLPAGRRRFPVFHARQFGQYSAEQRGRPAQPRSGCRLYRHPRRRPIFPQVRLAMDCSVHGRRAKFQVLLLFFVF